MDVVPVSLDGRRGRGQLIEVKQKIFSRTPWDHRKLCDIDMFQVYVNINWTTPDILIQASIKTFPWRN